MEESPETRAVAFTINTEITTIAISTATKVFLFDYSSPDEFNLVTVRNVPNVTYIILIEVFVILLIDHEDFSEASLVCFEIDEEEPKAKIDIKKFLQQKVIIRGGEESVFFATGTQLGAIMVPDMELLYQEDTGHTGAIVDFAISKTCIFTT